MIQTQRLLLRPFEATDAQEVFRLNGDAAVMQFLPKDEVYATPAEAETFLRGYLKKMEEIPYARWAVVRKSDEAWLGWCGLKLHDDGETDLGFRFHREYWGNGYATESGQAWLTWAWEEAGLNRVIAQTTDGNIGSQRALTKLGFIRNPTEDYEAEGFKWWRYEVGSLPQAIDRGA